MIPGNLPHSLIVYAQALVKTRHVVALMKQFCLHGRHRRNYRAAAVAVTRAAASHIVVNNVQSNYPKHGHRHLLRPRRHALQWPAHHNLQVPLAIGLGPPCTGASSTHHISNPLQQAATPREQSVLEGTNCQHLALLPVPVHSNSNSPRHHQQRRHHLGKGKAVQCRI